MVAGDDDLRRGFDSALENAVVVGIGWDGVKSDARNDQVPALQRTGKAFWSIGDGQSNFSARTRRTSVWMGAE
jgi:hypothetical protein